MIKQIGMLAASQLLELFAIKGIFFPFSYKCAKNFFKVHFNDEAVSYLLLYEFLIIFNVQYALDVLAVRNTRSSLTGTWNVDNTIHREGWVLVLMNCSKKLLTYTVINTCMYMYLYDKLTQKMNHAMGIKTERQALN